MTPAGDLLLYISKQEELEKQMSLKNEILNVLSLYEADAMTAKEIFEIYKGDDIKNISSSLSALFNTEKLLYRKSVVVNDKNYYAYWKKASWEIKTEEVPTIIKTIKTEPIVLTEPAQKVVDHIASADKMITQAEPTKEELIVMWLNGAEIEQSEDNGETWEAYLYPLWKEKGLIFRQCSEFIEIEAYVYSDDGEVFFAGKSLTNNIKLMFVRTGGVLAGVELLA
jgi:hypothetical protein